MVAVVIVIVVIPIPFRMPAMLVFIPPSMIGVPATLACFPQFTTGVVGLWALVTVTRHGLVEFMVSVRNAALAIVVVGAQKRRCGEHEKGSQRSCSERFGKHEIGPEMSHPW